MKIFFQSKNIRTQITVYEMLNYVRGEKIKFFNSYFSTLSIFGRGWKISIEEGENFVDVENYVLKIPDSNITHSLSLRKLIEVFNKGTSYPYKKRKKVRPTESPQWDFCQVKQVFHGFVKIGRETKWAYIEALK